MIFADLHNHTTASDGDFSPSGLVEQAASIGIKVLGITDHDTLAGLEEALEAGKKFNIDIVPGVEISIRFKRSFFTGTLHLLAYFRTDRLKDQGFVSKFQGILSAGRGEKLVRARVDMINHWFAPDGVSPVLERELKFEDIADLSSNASRRHFAIALKHKLNISSERIINSIIGNDSPAYLPSGIDLGEVAGFIRKESLLGVLAHPAAGSFPGKGHYREVLPELETVEKIFPEFIEAGIKGIEVQYPGHTEEHRKLMASWAQKYGLVQTGGSDCHDRYVRPPGVSGITRQDYLVFKKALYSFSPC